MGQSRRWGPQYVAHERALRIVLVDHSVEYAGNVKSPVWLEHDAGRRGEGRVRTDEPHLVDRRRHRRAGRIGAVTATFRRVRGRERTRIAINSRASRAAAI